MHRKSIYCSKRSTFNEFVSHPCPYLCSPFPMYLERYCTRHPPPHGTFHLLIHSDCNYVLPDIQLTFNWKDAEEAEMQLLSMNIRRYHCYAWYCFIMWIYCVCICGYIFDILDFVIYYYQSLSQKSQQI